MLLLTVFFIELKMQQTINNTINRRKKNISIQNWWWYSILNWDLKMNTLFSVDFMYWNFRNILIEWKVIILHMYWTYIQCWKQYTTNDKCDSDSDSKLKTKKKQKNMATMLQLNNKCYILWFELMMKINVHFSSQLVFSTQHKLAFSLSIQNLAYALWFYKLPFRIETMNI